MCKVQSNIRYSPHLLQCTRNLSANMEIVSANISARLLLPFAIVRDSRKVAGNQLVTDSETGIEFPSNNNSLWRKLTHL